MRSKTNSDPSGFIKLDRKILDWEWWDDVNTFRLFMTILLMANWEDKKWHGREIKRGQLWTSLPSLSKKAQLTIQQTRSSLDKLKLTGEITDESTASGRLVTVVKYDVYQGSPKKVTDKSTDKSTDNQQTSNRQPNRQPNRRATATKEYKEHKEIKNVIKEQQEQERGGGSATIDLNELLSVDDIVSLGKEYADVDSLIREVEYDANLKGKRIRNPYGYVCGYAINVGWPRK